MEDITYHVVKETDYARLLELYSAEGWWQWTMIRAILRRLRVIVQNTFCFVIAKKVMR